MSSFYRRTKNPATGVFEEAAWLDDYFGRHRYGVQFPDGKVYRQSDHQWEFEHELAMEEHPQLPFIRKAMCDLESLRDAAVCNGPGEQKLAAYLRAACKCCELALMEAEGKRVMDYYRQPENSPAVKAKLAELQRLVEKVHRREMLHLDLIEAVCNWRLATGGEREPDLKLIKALEVYRRAADEERD